MLWQCLRFFWIVAFPLYDYTGVDGVLQQVVYVVVLSDYLAAVVSLFAHLGYVE